MLPVAENPLFFLDYDGTLAPIVDDPSAAVPHPEIPPLLELLDDAFPLWIVTGRDLGQLAPLLNMPLRAIGLHGAQSGVIGEEVNHRMSDEAAEAISALRSSLPSIEGARVEEKSQAFAVHYRQAENPHDARERLEAWADAMPEMLDVIWGKKVVELRPKGLTKGTAVKEAVVEHPGRTPVYLGDDVTDEDAFEALGGIDRPAITVKVGDGETLASHRLGDPSEVAAYLKKYLEDLR